MLTGTHFVHWKIMKILEARLSLTGRGKMNPSMECCRKITVGEPEGEAQVLNHVDWLNQSIITHALRPRYR